MMFRWSKIPFSKYLNLRTEQEITASIHKLHQTELKAAASFWATESPLKTMRDVFLFYLKMEGGA